MRGSFQPSQILKFAMLLMHSMHTPLNGVSAQDLSYITPVALDDNKFQLECFAVPVTLNSGDFLFTWVPSDPTSTAPEISFKSIGGPHLNVTLQATCSDYDVSCVAVDSQNNPLTTAFTQETVELGTNFCIYL
ncbi:uncharacterized protein LOC142357892 [Convolutriloba macropyga]|uniref:uncharacterized protein LOC142357892 n=1 Tax=Convolutriloba macropyga TaxID=536237 RepID=UPI003F52658D